MRHLSCLRGVSTLTGFALAAEIGDWHRFTGASIGSFVGHTPAEYSSGGSRSLGPIAKTGNGHARRLLVEAPPPPLQGRQDQARPVGLAPAAARTAATGQRRHHRWVQSIDRRKRNTAANVAIATDWPAGAGLWPSWRISV